MYELKVQSHFDSAHFLRGYPGKCASEHGHRWVYEVVIEGDKLDKLGMLVDFVLVKVILKNQVESLLDHVKLNDLEAFQDKNPTAENIAEFIYGVIKKSTKDHLYGNTRLTSVTVWETPECGITYKERSK